ncbi:helix-hairpin-helix domain-containing protein [Leptospira santarosai]|uniref:Pathogenicity locus n=1 Tax=Leptospira santarosai serovar Arenal str. MAVJ 401 TaxID=1049976 RepID=M6JSD5_9LEPT|nr:helix-hairpin-helix domain-containing protein [Leptospira santarosai]EMF92312.1 pathogenicity locus [Leptospira santarosai str. ST188]EMM76766.1 pathogenicity locus [Leptospira santarosai str. 2000030832]EMN22508.1 pathogenicity locus [Leptospira santarosai serovar Arenal str. MAVJ 401]EMO14749.1 pathogenicity locus [Leptospira santarosai str. CBC523]EMO85539.1 pathogenicity locus [Leptospira santarosai str. AIM]
MSKKEYSKSSGEYPEQFDILKKFKTLPGVGKSIAMDYWNLGFRNLDEIRSADPEKLYVRCCELHGGHVDRCMLYVFRCVHYSLNAKKPNSEKLKWWNWKDSEKIQKSKR